MLLRALLLLVLYIYMLRVCFCYCDEIVKIMGPSAMGRTNAVRERTN